MKTWSLRNKLLLFSLLLLVVALGGMSWVGTNAMKQTSDEVISQISVSSRERVFDILDQASYRVASDVGSYMNRAFDTPVNMNHIISSGLQNPDKRLSRDEVQMLVRQAVAANPLVSSGYIQFEKNGYGDNDAAMIGAGEHTTTIGTLETYWVRENGTLNHYPTDDPNSKYSDTLNDLGDRESEWYLCSYETGKTCIVEPYLYEIEPGNEVLMTSLVTPIKNDGRFVGVAGSDINLPVLQQRMKEMSGKLFEGKAQLHLITAKGRIVASSQYAQKLSRPLSEADQGFAQALQGKNGEIFEFNQLLVAERPIHIEAPDTYWRLVLTVPESVAFAGVNQLKTDLQTDVRNTLGTQFVFSIVIIGVAAAAIVIFVGTITRPLNQMRERVFNLSSADGDLTQTLNIENHRELIEISQGINQFIAKLREMILALQEQSLQVQKQTNLLSEATTITTETIVRQTAEIGRG